LRSLPIKFSALIVTLSLGTCIILALLATQHERRSLTAEVAKRGLALALNLASNAKAPLLENDDLTLESLVTSVSQEQGVVAVRIRDREGNVIVEALKGSAAKAATKPTSSSETETRTFPTSAKRGKWLTSGAPILYSKLLIGDVQVTLDLSILVSPIIRESARQLTLAALAVVLVGVLAGIGFVRLLVGPLQRLRRGVEQLSQGDLSVRVPPSSRDEVGQLTRAFNEMGESLLQKEHLQTAFGRYVDDYVLQRLLEDPHAQDLQGVEREVTIIFIDIRNFTRLSEGLKASSVVALLNDVFQRITDTIHTNGGTIDKFIGDSVMAYFGAPIPRPDHAVDAVRTAIAIQEAIEERNAQSRARAGDHAITVELGIGIHTGGVVVGNIGGDGRMDFTVIGDAVNVAQRLEKLAGPRQILISEALQHKVRGNFKLNFEGERQLSGRREPVHVYSVERPRMAADASWNTSELPQRSA